MGFRLVAKKGLSTKFKIRMTSVSLILRPLHNIKCRWDFDKDYN